MIKLYNTYILNPVQAGFITQPENWKYSNARDFFGMKGLVELVLLSKTGASVRLRNCRGKYPLLAFRSVSNLKANAGIATLTYLL